MSDPIRDPIERRKDATRRLIAVPNTDAECIEVYACRRVDTMSLEAVGWAEIVGEDYLQALQSEMMTEDEKTTALLGKSEEEAKIILAEMERRENVATMGMIRHILLDRGPHGRAARLVSRCDAWIMASVEGIGVAKEGVEVGALPAGKAPREYCDELPGMNGAVIRPLRFVMEGEAYDPKKGVLAITDLWEDERIMLGCLIQATFSRIKRVRPLRGRQ